jgi:hypothetical protein
MFMSEFCAMDLFWDFTFTDIRHARPPPKKGVYVIRIQKRGKEPEEIISALAPHIMKLNWTITGNFLTSRISRIRNIDARCPVIYIGSAGTGPKSRHTLEGRYRDLASRHPVQYPLWALLYFGWELEYGWKVSDEPKELEAFLKKEYRKRQEGKLPALVARYYKKPVQ